MKKKIIFLSLLFLLFIPICFAQFTFYQITGGTTNNDTALVSTVDSNPSNAPMLWNTRYVKIVAETGVSYNSGDKLNLYVRSSSNNQKYFVHDAAGNISFANFTINNTYSWVNLTLANAASVTTLYISDMNTPSSGTNLFTDYTQIITTLPTTLNMYLDSYFINNNINILLSSSLVNIQHTLELRNASGNLFCQKNVTSPAVAFTQFSAQCTMPANAQTGSALFYPTNDKTKNVTGNFNIVNIAKDTTRIQINRVYYSPQVLQGGATEIFILLTGNLTKAITTLTYPNNSTRDIIMNPTGNVNEYKAFITDTFLTGDVSFTIKVISNNYYDDYSSHYTVVPYSLDFVNLVNKVDKILSQTPDIRMHGTEYTPGDKSKVWLQLLDPNKDEVDDAACFADIYYPNGKQFMERVRMHYVEDGIYQLDFIAPDILGVYPAIGICYYTIIETDTVASGSEVESGITISGDYTTTNLSDNLRWKINEELKNGSYQLSFNTTFSDIVEQNLSTDLTFLWRGKWGGENPSGLTIFIYNYNNDTWVPFNNKIYNTGGINLEVTNTIYLAPEENLSTLGYLKDEKIKIKIGDEDTADTIQNTIETDYMAVEVISLENGAWSEMRGSSEIHITDPYGYNFRARTLCGYTDSYSGKCGKFEVDTNILDEPQGIITDNITFTNTYEDDITSSFVYETAIGLDCTGILSIERIDAEGNQEDIMPEVRTQLGEKENCKLELPVHFEAIEKEFKIELKFDNYLKWEVNWAKDNVDAMKNVLDQYCENVAIETNYTYVVPLSTPTADGPAGYCERVMDDLWYFYDNFNTSQDISNAGEYESYLSESRFYLPIIGKHYTTITGYNWEGLLNNVGNIKNQTGQIIPPQGKLIVSGTEYSPGDPATIFLQFLDIYGNFINNGSCYLDIYYPLNNGTHAYTVIDAPMIPADHDDGLYYYDLTAPSMLGVYMVSAKCAYGNSWQWFYPEAEQIYYPIEQINSGTWQGSPQGLNSRKDGLYERCDGTIASPCSANYTFNLSAYGAGFINITSINAYFSGQSDTSGRTLTMYYYNGTGFTALTNTLAWSGTAGSVPTAYDEFLTNSIPVSAIINNTIKLRLTTPGSDRIFQNWLSLTILSSGGIITKVNGNSEMHITNIPNATSFSMHQKLDNISNKIDVIGNNIIYLNMSLTNLTNYLFSILTNFTSSQIYSLVSQNNQKLINIAAQQMHDKQFSEEQIYLITDSITQLQSIDEQVSNGKISTPEAKYQADILIDKTFSDSSFYTPNEIFIDVIDNNAISSITNEGTKEGIYNVVMIIKGFKTETFNFKLSPQETKILSMDLTSLPEGTYDISVISRYGKWESTAAARIFKNKEILEIQTEKITIDISDHKNPIITALIFFGAIILIYITLTNKIEFYKKQDIYGGNKNGKNL